MSGWEALQQGAPDPFFADGRELLGLIEQDDGGEYADTSKRDHAAQSGLDTFTADDDQ